MLQLTEIPAHVMASDGTWLLYYRSTNESSHMVAIQEGRCVLGYCQDAYCFAAYSIGEILPTHFILTHRKLYHSSKKFLDMMQKKSHTHTHTLSNKGRGKYLFHNLFFLTISFRQHVSCQQDWNLYCFQRSHLTQSTTEHFTYVAIQTWTGYSCKV